MSSLLFLQRAGKQIALALIVFVTVVAVEAAEKKSPEKTPEKSSGKHFLWRVTNAPAPFYLLGSFHALRRSDYPLPGVIDNAIGQSERFYFETDPKEDGKMASLVRRAATYPVGTQIQRKVRPETWAYLKKIARGGGYEWTNLKPWAIAMFALSHPGWRNISHSYGVEEYVQKKAKKPREFAGLETASEHVHVLSDMEDIEGEVFLLQTLVYADQGPQDFARDVAIWKVGATQRMWEAEQPRMKEAPTIYWRLLDRRNANWVPKIEAAIKAGKPTMIVAGSLHFCGPRSVIAQLRAHGYTIEQL